MFIAYLHLYLILSTPYTTAVLQNAAVLLDVDPPTPAPDLPLPGHPGNPGCLWTCTEPNWHGNCTYTCFGSYNTTAATCVRNDVFQSSFGPDAGTECNVYSGEKCEVEGMGTEMVWPGNPCMREYGSFECWRVEGADGTVGSGVAAVPSVQCPEMVGSSVGVGVSASGTLVSGGGAYTSRSGQKSTGGVTKSTGSSLTTSAVPTEGAPNPSSILTPIPDPNPPGSVPSGAIASTPTHPSDLPPGYSTGLPKPGTTISLSSFTPAPPQSSTTDSLRFSISQSSATSDQATSAGSSGTSGATSDNTANPTISNDISQTGATSVQATSSVSIGSLSGISITASTSASGSGASSITDSAAIAGPGSIPVGTMSDGSSVPSGTSGIPSGILSSDTHGIPSPSLLSDSAGFVSSLPGSRLTDGIPSLSLPPSPPGSISSLTFSYESHGIPSLSLPSGSLGSMPSMSGSTDTHVIPSGPISSGTPGSLPSLPGSTDTQGIPSLSLPLGTLGSIPSMPGSTDTHGIPSLSIPSESLGSIPSMPGSTNTHGVPSGPLSSGVSGLIPSMTGSTDAHGLPSGPISTDASGSIPSGVLSSASGSIYPGATNTVTASESAHPLPSINCVQYPDNPACTGGPPTPTTTDGGPPPWWNCDDNPETTFCVAPTQTAAAKDDDDKDLYGLFALLAVPVIAVGLKSWLTRAKVAKNLTGLRFKWPSLKKPRWGIHVPSIKIPKVNMPAIRVPPVGKAIKMPKISLPKGRMHCGRNSASSSMLCVDARMMDQLAPLGDAGAPSRQSRMCRQAPPGSSHGLQYECGSSQPPKPPPRAKTPDPPPGNQQQPPDSPGSPGKQPQPPDTSEPNPPTNDPYDQIDEETYTELFNEVYFADIPDGLRFGENANPPAEYREYAVGGGYNYVPPGSMGPQARKRAIGSAEDPTDSNSAQLTGSPAPATNTTNVGYCAHSTCVDPWSVPAQDDIFLTDDLVPPPGLAPSYYAEVDGSTAWLWTFYTTVSSQLTTSMTNGILMEDESDEDMAVLVWATLNSSEASTTSEVMSKKTSSTGKWVTKDNTPAQRTTEMSTLATEVVALTLFEPKETPRPIVTRCELKYCPPE